MAQADIEFSSRKPPILVSSLAVRLNVPVLKDASDCTHSAVTANRPQREKKAKKKTIFLKMKTVFKKAELLSITKFFFRYTNKSDTYFSMICKRTQRVTTVREVIPSAGGGLHQQNLVVNLFHHNRIENQLPLSIKLLTHAHP